MTPEIAGLPIRPARQSGAVHPLLRREPYRLLFPLGVALSWAGVLPWLLFALGIIDAWVPVFHAMAQVEGFLACIAAGFLLTMIPRRTATAPATAWEIAALASAPVGAAALAWFERWAISQVFWLVFLTVLTQFALRRFRARTAAQRVPASFVLVILALLFGAAGAVLAGVGAAREDEGLWWLHEVGRNLVLQGVMSCLVVGVGTLIVPHVTRGDAPAELPSARNTRLLYLAAGLVLAGSFFLEALVSVRWGFALRAAVLAAAFVPGARLWRAPSLPGMHRRLLWLGSWALPVGYALAAAFPEYRKACLHVVFIGCFATMVFSIALHVALTHAGRSEQLDRRRAGLVMLGALLGCALAARLLVDLDPPRLRLWLGCAAASFLGATVLWLVLAAHALREEPA
jgi:uncharacterized protein involved in response to NO